MVKQKDHKNGLSRSRLQFLGLAAVLLTSTIFGGLVHADKFDAQIKELQQKNALNQNLADEFDSQAKDYKDAVNRIQAQIDSLQKAISSAEHKTEIVKRQIAKAEADLDHFKQILGESIRTMYQEGQISTLEILASSNDLSDFVNKQQYRSAVQDKVKTTLDKINDLKATLEQKQRQLENIIRDKKNQQAERSAAQDKQSKLLAYSAGQRDAYNQRIQSNDSEIASLRAQQAAANQSHFGGSVSPGDPGHGGYPSYLDNSAQDSLIDPWGMFNRECVSYTAWKVQQTYGYMPYWGGHGNAIQWPGDAEADGIPTGSTPQRHSVAIWPVGSFGHAMWVEDVYSNGYIRVSQYNYDYQGHYSEMTIPSGGLTYIYFK